ncbi:MAG: DUF4118 domain-containing protein [Oscillospiraceae bacterium]|nr:DUF4118 domain-containing protein [Oscillospiraceae bacterium]
MSGLKKYLTVMPDFKDYIFTAAVLISAVGAGLLLRRFDDGGYGHMIYFLCVVLVARFTKGYLCGFISSVVGMLAVNFLFTYPYFELDFSIAGYPVTFSLMLTVSLIIGMLTTRLKAQNLFQADIEREKISGNLLRAVSHDIRTPLTSITGAASAIIDNGSSLDEEQIMSLVCDIKDEANKLIHMVENILTVTKIGEKTGTICKSMEAAEEIIGEAVRKFRKTRSVPVEIDIPGDLMLIPMDPILIEQVIVNIMENSVIHGKATMISLSLEQQGKNAVFKISDNGTGIADKVKKKLFEGYFIHADESMGDNKMNMGIGLSACRTIISVHGGELSAKNKPGGGAEFIFTLPMEQKKKNIFDTDLNS